MSIIINNFQILDYIILIIIFLIVFFSIWRGFLQSFLVLMTWIGSIIITLIFYPKLSDYVASKLNLFIFLEKSGLSEILGIFISIPVIFLISLILLKKLKKIISSDLNKSSFGIVMDKLFGIVYGFFFSYFILSIILFFLDYIMNNTVIFLINNSEILNLINKFNNTYIYQHLPFLSENSENFIN